MKTFATFGTTLLGGLLFLVPLVVIVVIVGRAYRAALKVLHPLAEALPMKTVIGVETPNLAAALVLLLIVFLVGLLARSGPGSWFGDRLEVLITRFKPGYAILRAASSGGIASRINVALVLIDDMWVPAFVMDRHEGGLVTIYLPDAPSATSGSLALLREDQVKVLDLPFRKTFLMIRKAGMGSNALADAALRAGIPFENPGSRG